METSSKLNVYYIFGDKKLRRIYRLAQADYRVAFEYADSWIESGFTISPFSLPLENFIFKV